MTAEYPTVEQIPQLKALWKEAFGDTDLFLDAFFDVGFSPRRCRCIPDGEGIAAALYWFDVYMQEQKFAYLYAVATAAERRNQGLFARLLSDTKEVLIRGGYAGIVLVPQDAGLCRMYEKFGFVCCSTMDAFAAGAGQIPAGMREIGAAEYACLRKKMLPAGGVLQEGELLAFLATQCRFWTGDGWLAVGQVLDGKLVCAEILGDRNAAAGLVRALGVPVGEFRAAGKSVPFAWYLPLKADCGRPAYFALALD